MASHQTTEQKDSTSHQTTYQNFLLHTNQLVRKILYHSKRLTRKILQSCQPFAPKVAASYQTTVRRDMTEQINITYQETGHKHTVQREIIYLIDIISQQPKVKTLLIMNQ